MQKVLSLFESKGIISSQKLKKYSRHGIARSVTRVKPRSRAGATRQTRHPHLVVSALGSRTLLPSVLPFSSFEIISAVFRCFPLFSTVFDRLADRPETARICAKTELSMARTESKLPNESIMAKKSQNWPKESIIPSIQALRMKC